MERKRNTKLWAAVVMSTAVFMLVSAAFVQADPVEIDQIRQAIKAKGAKWHADETSVSNLNSKERKLRLGASEDEEFLAQVLSSSETAPIPQVEGAPATVDWRSPGGLSYVSPVKNQGSCGSCWAFAATAGMESQVMIGKPGTQIDLSEQILVSCSGIGSCSGGSSASASTYLRDVGLPPESCFPYTASNNLCSNNTCPDWQSNSYKIRGWHQANTSTSLTADDLRNALYAYGPVVATFYVYNDFYSYRSGVYSYTTGAYVGAHAILVVGYDDSQQAFIVKNSWGPGWGEAGYFMIAYSELAGTSRFGYSTMVYDGYGDTPPPNPAPVTCTYSLSATSVTVKAAGGKGNFSLYAQGSCTEASMATVASDSWVDIVSSDPSTGGGALVSYTVGLNTGAARSATISIAGLRYTINQQKAVTNLRKK